MYHGEFNDKRPREGCSIKYDEESGKMVVEGIWSKEILIEAIRRYDEDTMTELKRKLPTTSVNSFFLPQSI